jgi:hypothetical protein
LKMTQQDAYIDHLYSKHRGHSLYPKKGSH